MAEFNVTAQQWVLSKIQDAQEAVQISPSKATESVLINNCKNCVVQVDDAVSAVSIENCCKVGVLLHSVKSYIELVRCSSCKLQCTSVVYTIDLSKCNEVQLFLQSHIARSVSLVTSLSDGINLVELFDEDGAESHEHAVPSQFNTRFDHEQNAFITRPVVHAGSG